MKQVLMSQIITLATPILVPILIAFIKEMTERIPKPALPFLAIVLGAVVDTINYFVTGGGLGPVGGAILGAAGIGLREAVDQLKKSLAPAPPKEEGK